MRELRTHWNQNQCKYSDMPIIITILFFPFIDKRGFHTKYFCICWFFFAIWIFLFRFFFKHKHHTFSNRQPIVDCTSFLWDWTSARQQNVIGADCERDTLHVSKYINCWILLLLINGEFFFRFDTHTLRSVHRDGVDEKRTSAQFNMLKCVNAWYTCKNECIPFLVDVLILSMCGNVFRFETTHRESEGEKEHEMCVCLLQMRVFSKC